MRWDGTPERSLEWNDKHVRRCAKCKRLGPTENYKEGQLALVNGQHVREWLCKDGCKPARVEHYENARGPKELGDDPPRLRYVETMKYPKRKNKPNAKAEARDIKRIAGSSFATGMNSEVWSDTNAMKHPSPRSQLTKKHKPKKGR